MKWEAWAQVLQYCCWRNLSALSTWPTAQKTLQAWEFTFISPQPHHDEMLQQPGSRPSKNNSKKCQTSVSEMRPGEVRCILYVPPPSPSPPQHPLNATKRQIGSGQLRNTATPWHHKEQTAMYTCKCYTSSSSSDVYYALSKGDITQTHWESQNSLWVMQTYRDQNRL